ncbi:hypothetical protein TSAR_010246 [Trichomalopsis sarcophagae]|uniref:Uncharacterized protein n=1 Tax=Trichomalopsis sarcophagae TaxID=543379 RepID=A0A232EFJ1_9HYME|nr:hypothetical protein TSAR_010246 [Trichomalopsis sarcophagae]
MDGKKNFQAVQQIFYICRDADYDDEFLASGNKENNVTLPDGYVILTPGIGARKLHLTPKIWSNARKDCVKEGGSVDH